MTKGASIRVSRGRSCTDAFELSFSRLRNALVLPGGTGDSINQPSDSGASAEMQIADDSLHLFPGHRDGCKSDACHSTERLRGTRIWRVRSRGKQVISKSNLILPYEKIAEALKRKLSAEGRDEPMPRDMIDVHSFIWIIGPGYAVESTLTNGSEST